MENTEIKRHYVGKEVSGTCPNCDYQGDDFSVFTEQDQDGHTIVSDYAECPECDYSINV